MALPITVVDSEPWPGGYGGRGGGGGLEPRLLSLLKHTAYNMTRWHFLTEKEKKSLNFCEYTSLVFFFCHSNSWLTTSGNMKRDEIKNFFQHITVEQNIDLRMSLGIDSPKTMVQVGNGC